MTKTVENKGLITEMFAAGAHFGYSRSRRHPSAKPFIFGTKNGIEIMDLEKTSVELANAKEFIKTLAKGGKQILFVGTKSESKKGVRASAIALFFASSRYPQPSRIMSAICLFLESIILLCCLAFLQYVGVHCISPLGQCATWNQFLSAPQRVRRPSAQW